MEAFILMLWCQYGSISLESVEFPTQNSCEIAATDIAASFESFSNYCSAACIERTGISKRKN